MIALPRRPLSRGAAIILALTLLATGACTGGSGQAAVCAPATTSSPDTSPDRTPEVPDACDQLTGLTSFASFGRDAYWHVAAELGLFADAGLDVRVQPGAGARNLTLLGSGEAHFAAVDMTSYMVNVADQDNRVFTAVAAIHQLAPAALMTVDPDITGPHDLAGKTVALFGPSVVHILLPAYVGQVGLDPGQVDIVDTEPAALPSVLASGAADAIEQFTMGEPTIQAAAGDRPVTVLPYSDYLPDLYGVVLVTTTALAGQRPELVGRFRDALLHGLEHSLDHPDQAGQILAEQLGENQQYAQVAAAELEIMDSYSRLPATPLGHIDQARVSRSIALLEGIGVIDNGELYAEDIVDFDLAPAGHEPGHHRGPGPALRSERKLPPYSR